LIWIANYQVDRNQRRIANDLRKFGFIEGPRGYQSPLDEEGRARQAMPTAWNDVRVAELALVAC